MKAAELNGVPLETFKDMSEYCIRYVFDFIDDFWHEIYNFRSWHTIQCVPVPNPGDFSYPNKWQGEMLMDLMSDIFICVINIRCFEILDAHGTKYQFCGTPNIGCRDGIFNIKNLLNMRKNHNLPTFVALLDLVKAADTTCHELLIKVMEIYGAPKEFCSAIHKMYQYLIHSMNRRAKLLWSSIYLHYFYQ